MQHLLGQSCYQTLANTNDNASGMSTSPDRAMPVAGGVSNSIGSLDQQAESDARDSETCQFTQSHSHMSATKRLYVSHFLSGWNTRVFEFGAVLYLASLFPDSLFPLSIYALVRGTSAIFLSPAVGQYIDTGDRLQVAKFSIVFQRVAVALSCLVFLLLLVRPDWIISLKWGALLVLSALACVEKLCSIMYLVSVERDWVVVIAGDDMKALGVLNSQMRRIDLFCKLAGPFAIGLLDGMSTKVAVMANLVMGLLSVVIELYALIQVYKMVPALSTSKQELSHTSSTDQPTQSRAKNTLFHRATSYFRHPAMIPSFSCAILYFTVLSFSGQMITYLLSVGFSSINVAIVRTFSVTVELFATFLAPTLMTKIGPIRAGIWFINWQSICLIIGASLFWNFQSSVISSIGLVGGTILSRVGLWGFDLCIQIIVQEEVESDQRGSFSTQEAAWQNFFELGSYITTLAFYRLEQFRWPVLVSVIAVIAAQGLYATFVRTRRGHLVHLPFCVDLKGERARRLIVYERIPDTET